MELSGTQRNSVELSGSAQGEAGVGRLPALVSASNALMKSRSEATVVATAASISCGDSPLSGSPPPKSAALCQGRCFGAQRSGISGLGHRGWNIGAEKGIEG